MDKLIFLNLFHDPDFLLHPEIFPCNKKSDISKDLIKFFPPPKLIKPFNISQTKHQLELIISVTKPKSKLEPTKTATMWKTKQPLAGQEKENWFPPPEFRCTKLVAELHGSGGKKRGKKAPDWKDFLFWKETREMRVEK